METGTLVYLIALVMFLGGGAYIYLFGIYFPERRRKKKYKLKIDKRVVF